MRAEGPPLKWRQVRFWADDEEMNLYTQHAVFAGCHWNEWLVRCLQRGIADQLEIDRDAGFEPAHHVGGRKKGER